MTYSNLISATIHKKDLKEILDAIEFIQNKMSYLLTLSEEEIDALPKTHDGTIDFVKECLFYAKELPEYIPEDVDVIEIQKDVDLHGSINEVLQPLKQFVKKLEDNALLAASEAYLPSLAIFNSVKCAKPSKASKAKGLAPA